MDSFFDFLAKNPMATSVVIIAFSLVVIATVIIYLTAFLQGREISFYPPKIGAKPTKNLDTKFSSQNISSIQPKQNVTILNNPKEIIESTIQSLQSVEPRKVVVWRVLPLEFTTDIFSSYSELADQYEKIMGEIILKGENDIGFIDATIYGHTHDKKVNAQTAAFIRKNYLPFSDTSSIGINSSINHFGFFMIGESETGSNIQWKQAILFFSSTSPRRLPVSGVVIKDSSIIENVLKNWWLVLQKECQDSNQYWNSASFVSKQGEWKKVITQVITSVESRSPQQD